MHKECVSSSRRLRILRETVLHFREAGETVDYCEDVTRLLFCVERTDEIDVQLNHGLIRRDCEVMSLNGYFDVVHLLTASALSDEVSYRRDPLVNISLLLSSLKISSSSSSLGVISSRWFLNNRLRKSATMFLTPEMFVMSKSYCIRATF